MDFFLCTMQGDFEWLSEGPYVVLQHSGPTDVAIEAAHGNAAGQREMLNRVERVL
jgi:hypothetical protein